jgi:hypothetical protein
MENTNTENGGQNLSPEEFIGLIQKSVLGRRQATEAKQAAASVNPQEALAGAQMKPTNPVEAEGQSFEARRKGFINPLRKSLEELAMLHPAFHHLGSEAVLADPYNYLHSKSADGTRRVSDGQLDQMAMALLQKGKGQNGVPLSVWMATGGQQKNIERQLEDALRKDMFDGAVAKALDTTLSSGVGGGALVRTDIDPILQEAYLRSFPMLDLMRTFPANGVVHTYDVRTGVGNAATVSELGDIVTAGADATSTIERKANSNIGIIVSRRGISLKLQFASGQSGMNFPLAGTENLEVVGGVTAIAKKNQYLVCQGNYSTASKTLGDEDGLTDQNGFDGLRTILKNAATSKTFASGELHRTNLNKLIAQISDDGGDISNLRICGRHGAMISFTDEMEDFVRVIGSEASNTGIPRNILDGGYRTYANVLSRYIPVPGSSQGEGIGYYDISSVTYEDVYLVDPRGIGLAYLGSPSPVVLELPVGFDNKLGNVYILFLMNGLVVNIPKFQRKYRIPRQIY